MAPEWPELNYSLAISDKVRLALEWLGLEPRLLRFRAQQGTGRQGLRIGFQIRRGLDRGRIITTSSVS